MYCQNFKTKQGMYFDAAGNSAALLALLSCLEKKSKLIKCFIAVHHHYDGNAV